MKKLFPFFVVVLFLASGCSHKNFKNAKSLLKYLTTDNPSFSAKVALTSGKYREHIDHKQNNEYAFDTSNFYETHNTSLHLDEEEETIFPCVDYENDFLQYNLIDLKSDYFYVWGCLSYQTSHGSDRPSSILIEYEKFDKDNNEYEGLYPNPNKFTIGKNIRTFEVSDKSNTEIKGKCTYEFETWEYNDEYGIQLVPYLNESCEFTLSVVDGVCSFSLVLPENIYSTEKTQIDFTFIDFKKHDLNLDAYNNFVEGEKRCSLEN